MCHCYRRPDGTTLRCRPCADATMRATEAAATREEQEQHAARLAPPRAQEAA